MRYVFSDRVVPRPDDVIALMAEDADIQWAGDKDDATLVGALKKIPPLIHLENVDNEALSRTAISIARRLGGVPTVITGRANAYSGTGLPLLNIKPFGAEDALEHPAIYCF